MTWFRNIDQEFLKKPSSRWVFLNAMQRTIQNHIRQLNTRVDGLKAEIQRSEGLIQRQVSGFEDCVDTVVANSESELQRYLIKRSGLEGVVAKMMNCSIDTDSVPALAVNILQRFESFSEIIIQRHAVYIARCRAVIAKLPEYLFMVKPGDDGVDVAGILNSLSSIMNPGQQETTRVSSDVEAILKQSKLNKNQQQHILNLLKKLIKHRCLSENRQREILKANGSKRFCSVFDETYYKDTLSKINVVAEDYDSVLARNMRLTLGAVSSGNYSSNTLKSLLECVGSHPACQLTDNEKNSIHFIIKHRDREPTLATYSQHGLLNKENQRSSCKHARAVQGGIARIKDYQHAAVASLSIETTLLATVNGHHHVVQQLSSLRHRSRQPDSVCKTIPKAVGAAKHNDQTLDQHKMAVKETHDRLGTCRQQLVKTQEELQQAKQLLKVLKLAICSATVSYLVATEGDRQRSSWWHGTRGAERALRLYNSAVAAKDITAMRQLISGIMVNANGGYCNRDSRCNDKSLNMFVIFSLSRLVNAVLMGSEPSNMKLATSGMDRYCSRWRTNAGGAILPQNECKDVATMLINNTMLTNNLRDSELAREIRPQGSARQGLFKRSQRKAIAQGLQCVFMPRQAH